MLSELDKVLEEIRKDKGIDKEVLINALETALVKAAHNKYGQGLDIISEGSGLGLFITKKIIELHGGTIRVKSKGRNKGTTFYFTLPIINDKTI